MAAAPQARVAARGVAALTKLGRFDAVSSGAFEHFGQPVAETTTLDLLNF